MILFLPLFCCGQTDSLRYSQVQIRQSQFPNVILRKDLITPISLMTFGVVSIRNPYLKNQNTYIRNELQENIRYKFPIDDYTQYLNTAAFLGLSYLGIPAKHNLKQRLFTGAVSHAIMAGAVNIMKSSIPIVRPDYSADNSFPSGHTATAFVGAELMWQEYRDKSIWYGVAGYAVATGTGFFRMYNNKHWLTDVAMGAGVGILSTKIAYWMLPLIEGNSNKLPSNFVVLPGYDGQHTTVSMVLTL